MATAGPPQMRHGSSLPRRLISCSPFWPQVDVLARALSGAGMQKRPGLGERTARGVDHEAQVPARGLLAGLVFECSVLGQRGDAIGSKASPVVVVVNDHDRFCAVAEVFRNVLEGSSALGHVHDRVGHACLVERSGRRPGGITARPRSRVRLRGSRHPRRDRSLDARPASGCRAGFHRGPRPCRQRNWPSRTGTGLGRSAGCFGCGGVDRPGGEEG